jgi:hypothetical protein
MAEKKHHTEKTKLKNRTLEMTKAIRVPPPSLLIFLSLERKLEKTEGTR